MSGVVRAALKLALAALMCFGVASCLLWAFMLCSDFPIAPLPSPSELPDSRSDYSSYDLASRRLTLFNEQCATAREANESWTEDPRQVGLRFAGYPNIDGTSPDIVRVFHPEPGKVIVVVIDMGLMDDSVEAIKTRVDLVQEGEAWEVQWGGWQVRCWGGRGGWYWHAGHCV
jgi:hypothetical protein